MHPGQGILLILLLGHLHEKDIDNTSYGTTRVRNGLSKFPRVLRPPGLENVGPYVDKHWRPKHQHISQFRTLNVARPDVHRGRKANGKYFVEAFTSDGAPPEHVFLPVSRCLGADKMRVCVV